MAIDNDNIIDFIGIDEENNEVILTISDHLDWELKMDHLLKLQAKVNAYIDFIDSGEIHKEYTNSIGRNIVIEIRGKYDLPKDSDVNEFCNKLESVLKEVNITIRFKKL